MGAEVIESVPELSIVIPAYNASKYIMRTLTSLENQTVSPEKYRIIVVDDGSTDDTLHLCTQFAEKHPNIWVIHKVNGGVSSARNTGMAVATGKWLTFVDSDDYVDKRYVETIIGTCPEEDYVIFDNFLERGNNLVAEKTWMQPFCNKKHDISKVLLWICDNRLNAPWDKRFSLKVIKNNLIQFPCGINMGEDILFNFEYALHVTSAYLCDYPIYIHTDNLEGLCHKSVSVQRMFEYEAIYSIMQSACIANRLEANYLHVINLAFLRIITRCAGQLYASGNSVQSIAQHFDESRMVRMALEEPTMSCKDIMRKLLLKTRLYNICNAVFK